MVVRTIEPIQPNSTHALESRICKLKDLFLQQWREALIIYGTITPGKLFREILAYLNRNTFLHTLCTHFGPVLDLW